MHKEWYVNGVIRILFFTKIHATAITMQIRFLISIIFLLFKGSRSHLQISLNIRKLGKNENYTIMMMCMNMKPYTCWL